MGETKFPKAGEWRPSTVHRFAVVSDQRIAHSAAFTDPEYWGGHLVADVASPSLVPIVAAAPDLAEACRMLVESYDADMGTYAIGKLYEAREAARAALSKARGEAP